jgi:hypothetical protein
MRRVAGKQARKALLRLGPASAEDRDLLAPVAVDVPGHHVIVGDHHRLIAHRYHKPRAE